MMNPTGGKDWDAVNDTRTLAEWEAENDARTLAEADVIRNDSVRRTAAEKAAVDMAKTAKDNLDYSKEVGK